MSYKEKLLQHFYSMISENRGGKFESIVHHRTRYITVVLEDIFQPHNASAVLRSCDGFGIQDVHIIENANKYRINPDVELGTSKWLTMKKYNSRQTNTENCIQHLKKNNYRIVVTSPHASGCELKDLDIHKGKIALCMGTELHGASETLMNMADEYVRIPMFGFTESFNISVSAAIGLYDLSTKLRHSNINWKLSEEEMIDIKLDWARNSLNKAELIEKEFETNNHK